MSSTEFQLFCHARNPSADADSQSQSPNKSASTNLPPSVLPPSTRFSLRNSGAFVD
jgi:hypothetical protein